MNKTKQLSDHDHDVVWGTFAKEFNFKPSTTALPGIESSLPSLKLDVSACRDAGMLRGPFVLPQLSELAQEIFSKICEKDETIYALDWQHDSFEFNPLTEIQEWPIPTYPNGDYFIFLTKDYKNVWFGHPWENTITLFGSKIVETASKRLDELREINIVPVVNCYRVAIEDSPLSG